MRTDSKARTTPTQITIAWNETHQEIDGFGAAFPWQAYYLRQFAASSDVLDLLFSTNGGAGLSIIRNQINCPSADHDFGTIEPYEGVWEFTHDMSQIWLMTEAIKRGTTRFISSVWSPPGWMKTNGSCVNVTLDLARPFPQVPSRQSVVISGDTQGRLDPSKRQAFADYLSRYVREYKSRFDLNIFAVSIANEPEVSTWYDSALWSAAEISDFIGSYLKPTFDRDGVSSRILIPETSSWDSIEAFAQAALDDPAASGGVDIIGAHHYAGAIRPISSATALGKRVWQTEVSNLGPDDTSIIDALHWALDIHEYMVVAESNAWLWWWGALCYESGADYGSGQGLVYFKLEDNTFSARKRLYSIGNYCRFIRPGYIRIGTAPHPSVNVYVSAYKDPVANKLVIVAINRGIMDQPITVDVSQTPVGEFAQYITSNSQNLTQIAKISTSNGIFATTLPARSITTFAG